MSLSPWTRDARPEWFDRAACRSDGVPVEVFFPFTYDVTDNFPLKKIRRAEHTAKQVCVGCPVRSECLTYGLDEAWGIWGGRTARERRHIARNLRSTTA